MPDLPPPSRADRAWLASVLGGDERSLRVRRLKGGISSAVHAVEIVDSAGEHLLTEMFPGTTEI